MIKRRTLLQAGLASLALPYIVRAQSVSGQITILTYAGIFQDAYMETVIRPFQKAFPDVKVNYTTAATSAKMLGDVRAQKDNPQIDVALFDSSLSMIGNEEGVFERFDTSVVPALGELFPEARDYADGYGPAITYDHLAIVYDTQLVNPAPVKLADFWRPDLKGWIATAAPPSVQGHAMTVMVAHMLGGDFRQSIDPAIAKLAELAPSIQTFDPQPDTYSLVLNGVARVGTGWNARAQTFSNQSKGRLGVVTPQEGSVAVVNTINLVKGAPNRSAALAFINFALGKDAQSAFSERMFYGTTNAQAKIAPDVLARTTSGPDNRAKLIPLKWSEIVPLRDNWNNRWRREVIAKGGN
ncbi:ABC transporter substrate-binding protein [Ensifer canadensis]